MSTHTILCGSCGTPVEGTEDPKPQDRINCSKCGQSDTYAAVVKSAEDFVTDKVAESLNTSMANAVRGSKYVKFTPGHVPKRRYRWTVADFKL
jgi:hypothetical protein